MRPRVKIKIGVKAELKSALETALSEKGPMSEKELWEESIAFFDPKMRAAAGKLRRLYRASFGRKIGQKTAELNVVTELRSMLSSIKKQIKHTDKPIQLGKTHFGRIFYVKGQENQITKKLEQIVLSTPSRALEVLLGVRNGPMPITPSFKRAINLLHYYELIELRRIAGKTHAVELGWVGETMIDSKPTDGPFPSHFRIWKPFSASTWVLKEGPEKARMRFDLAAWNPIDRIFYLGLDRKYVGLKEIKALKEKSVLLHLPAKLVVFCQDISDSAKRYAEKWGIELKQI
ncbi:MAG: hypothetical protein GOU99_03930 [Candidatus Altiarchaeota archaeon]|nr:hypothetical protein [Candidatus Altiarchaeota archaeon]